MYSPNNTKKIVNSGVLGGTMFHFFYNVMQDMSVWIVLRSFTLNTMYTKLAMCRIVCMLRVWLIVLSLTKV